MSEGACAVGQQNYAYTSQHSIHPLHSYETMREKDAHPQLQDGGVQEQLQTTQDSKCGDHNLATDKVRAAITAAKNDMLA